MEQITGKWGVKEFFVRWMREAFASGAALLAFAVAGTIISPTTFGSWGDLALWIEKLVLVFASGFIAGLASSLSKLIRVKKEENTEENTDVSDNNVASQGQ